MYTTVDGNLLEGEAKDRLCSSCSGDLLVVVVIHRGTIGWRKAIRLKTFVKLVEEERTEYLSSHNFNRHVAPRFPVGLLKDGTARLFRDSSQPNTPTIATLPQGFPWVSSKMEPPVSSITTIKQALPWTPKDVLYFVGGSWRKPNSR